MNLMPCNLRAIIIFAIVDFFLWRIKIIVNKILMDEIIELRMNNVTNHLTVC